MLVGFNLRLRWGADLRGQIYGGRAVCSLIGNGGRERANLDERCTYHLACLDVPKSTTVDS
jgi:hypothetical protein